jgi:hypothetical protein
MSPILCNESQPDEPNPVHHTEIPYKSEHDEVSDTVYEMSRNDVNEENPQPPAIPIESEEPEIESDDLIDISKGAVGFNANFTEKGQTMKSAHTFTSETDTTVSIYASTGNISVVNADTNEVVYDGSKSDEKTAHIPMTGGEHWCVSVISTDEGESNATVYTYGYTDDTEDKTE